MTPEEVIRMAAEDPDDWISPKSAVDAILRAIAADREVCAKWVEELFPRIDGSGWLSRDIKRAVAKEIADAIRARKDS